MTPLKPTGQLGEVIGIGGQTVIGEQAPVLARTAQGKPLRCLLHTNPSEPPIQEDQELHFDL